MVLTLITGAINRLSFFFSLYMDERILFVARGMVEFLISHGDRLGKRKIEKCASW